MGFVHKLFSYEYINKEHLTGLDRYKYNCVDTSPLSIYVMQPFWSAIVNLYPKWLAPNVLTLVGFLCLILQSLMFSIYDYSFYGYCFDRSICFDDFAANLTVSQLDYYNNLNSYDQVPSNVCSCTPRWLFLLISICQFLSHHLDGTDGKQARRTNSSSPLGELFDHGLDSWATLFLPVALFSIFGRNGEFGLSVFSMYGILWLILLSFIVSHWEKYNTGVMFLPWSYDLSQVGMTFLFFLTWAFGQEVWFFRFPSFLSGLPSTQFIEVLIYVSALGLSVPFSVYNMYQAAANKTFKQESLYEGIRPLFSTAYLFAIQMIWLLYSPSKILELEPRAFFWLTGTLFSNIACRLIIAQMTSTRCNIFNIGLIPLTIVVAIFCSPIYSQFPKVFTKQSEVYLLYTLVVVVTVQHIHYGVCMVRQICKHLNIYCFVITSKPNRSRKVE